jgi:dipeptidase E
MIDQARRLLLISNSTLFGGGYLDHAEPAIRDFLKDICNVLFVPFALFDRDAYTDQAERRFAAMGYALTSIHRAADVGRALASAEAVFIGGGNTFRLLKALQEHGLLDEIRRRVDGGMPYIGSSAGSIVACPTIRTTNDMPIVWPRTLDAMSLVPFQINGHYLDPDPSSTHMGETRELRIRQYLEENATPVVGLREGTMLRVEKGLVSLHGAASARVFRRHREPVEVPPGGDVAAPLGGA